MTRGRFHFVTALRLAVYLAAATLVLRPPRPAAPGQAAISIARTRSDEPAHSAPSPLTGALIVMLMAGVLLEIRTGAARWR